MTFKCKKEGKICPLKICTLPIVAVVVVVDKYGWNQLVPVFWVID